VAEKSWLEKKVKPTEKQNINENLKN